MSNNVCLKPKFKSCDFDSWVDCPNCGHRAGITKDGKLESLKQCSKGSNKFCLQCNYTPCYRECRKSWWNWLFFGVEEPW